MLLEQPVEGLWQWQVCPRLWGCRLPLSGMPPGGGSLLLAGGRGRAVPKVSQLAVGRGRAGPKATKPFLWCLFCGNPSISLSGNQWKFVG